MRFPGFTAEAALARSRGTYRSRFAPIDAGSGVSASMTTDIDWSSTHPGPVNRLHASRMQPNPYGRCF
jgi:hypothetical protein